MSMNPKEFKKIAIIGATTNPNKFGNIVLKDLRKKDLKFILLARITMRLMD